MSKELESLGVILENLPDEIEFISFLKDKKTGEFLISCNHNKESNYNELVDMLMEINADDFIEDNSNFIAGLLALFFSFTPVIKLEVLEKIKNGIEELMLEKK